jgi:uncharacterized protein (DUF58 family)
MQNRQEGRRYLNPTVLARIGNLELIAKCVVEGFISGLHKSPYHGFSVEFAQYRQYMPGDDTKYIDWKVYGRTDRYYIKQFEEETNLNCYLLLDTSRSMAHPDPRDLDANPSAEGDPEALTKLQYASYMIASMAYFMAKQRDAVGFSYFDDTLHEFLPARSSPSHLHTILLTLERLQTEKRTRLAEPLHQIADRLTKRGLVILVSDLYEDEPDDVVKALEHFRYDGHEVVVFHVLDHRELEFEFEQMTRMIRFVDSETDEEIITTPDAIRDSYLSHHNDFVNHYKLALSQADIDYNMINTATPIDLALSSYLAKREGLM